MPSYPLQNLCLAVIAGTPVLAACFVVLRIYARRRFGLHLGWDDYTIATASVLSLALIYPSVRNVHMWHYGIHIWNVDQSKLEPDYDEYHRVLIAFNLIHAPILPLVKASIIILLLKAGRIVVAIRRTLYGILAFNIGACVGPLFALLFMCPPRTGQTQAPTVFNGLKCLQQRPGAIIYLFLVSVNMFTDILILPIPSLLMYRVQNTSIRARLTVVFSSALILGATAIGAVRLKLNWESMLYKTDVSDWTYNITYCLNHAENNAAIMLACMPILRTLIVRWSSKRDEETLAPGEMEMRNQSIYRESLMLRSIPAPETGDKKPSIVKKEWINNDSTLGLTLPAHTKTRSFDTDQSLELPEKDAGIVRVVRRGC